MTNSKGPRQGIKRRYIKIIHGSKDMYNNNNKGTMKAGIVTLFPSLSKDIATV
jgi:hypothetical protein